MSQAYGSYGARQTGAGGAGVPENSILGVLKAAEISDSKPVLPAGEWCLSIV